MKKVFLMLMVFCATTLMAQDEMVSIPKSQLTEQQKTAIAVKNTTETIETASKYVGLGKEVGQAINGGLSALTHHLDTISNTNVGKFTMFIIAYKVVGTDIIQFAVGIPLLIIVTIVSMTYYFQNIRKRKFKTIIYDKEGKIERTAEDISRGADSEETIGWFVFSMIAYGVCFIVLFA